MVIPSDVWDREDLQRIRGHAHSELKRGGLDSNWKRALENLQHAADCLDAMIARYLVSLEEGMRKESVEEQRCPTCEKRKEAEEELLDD